MNKKRQLRVGLFGIGLDTYWPQFMGLKPRLEGYVLAMCASAPAKLFVAAAQKTWPACAFGSLTVF
jgi:L-arabinose isomerase